MVRSRSRTPTPPKVPVRASMAVIVSLPCRPLLRADLSHPGQPPGRRSVKTALNYSVHRKTKALRLKLKRPTPCSTTWPAHLFSQSAHFGGSPVAPQGMIGTDEVEFFGEPSTSLSE